MSSPEGAVTDEEKRLAAQFTTDERRKDARCGAGMMVGVAGQLDQVLDVVVLGEDQRLRSFVMAVQVINKRRPRSRLVCPVCEGGCHARPLRRSRTTDCNRIAVAYASAAGPGT